MIASMPQTKLGKEIRLCQPLITFLVIINSFLFDILVAALLQLMFRSAVIIISIINIFVVVLNIFLRIDYLYSFLFISTSGAVLKPTHIQVCWMGILNFVVTKYVKKEERD